MLGGYFSFKFSIFKLGTKKKNKTVLSVYFFFHIFLIKVIDQAIFKVRGRANVSP